MNRDSFSGFHPSVNLLYFISVIGFAMFFAHPVCLGISLFCALIYSVYLNGGKSIRFNLVYMLPLLIMTAAVNPLLNHRGATILAYLPSGNPVTLESILYGVSAAVMLISVISWFSCFNSVITSDKLVYLFGRIIPATSLILAMSLRFAPRFASQIKIISNARKCMGLESDNGRISLRRKIKSGVKILSAIITWSLENAIETADSMKRRGYGLPGRTSFSIYNFGRRDACAIIYIIICSAVIISGTVTGMYSFEYYPVINAGLKGYASILFFAAYFFLALFPLIINIKEDLTWKYIISKT
ncbi:MAG: energy-coupling factor transporter transmembrane protein EcfT [Oscillospiraceae bacterium]|nr:energy-coupling factor transporter transmembrane protein EcfT [Oscillospiraceae bacterium]